MRRVTSTQFNQFHKSIDRHEDALMITVNGKPERVLLSNKIFQQILGILSAYYLTNREVLDTDQLVYLKDLLKTLDCPEGFIED